MLTAFDNFFTKLTARVEGNYLAGLNNGGFAGFRITSRTLAFLLDGKNTEVKLHPIDLGMEKSRGTRGRPALSRSQETLEYLAKLSEPYGVSIDIEEGVGTIRL